MTQGSGQNIGTLHLDLGDRSYDILVGEGLLDDAGDLMAPVLDQPRVVIVTDENAALPYRAPLEASLDRAGIAHQCIVMPPGEPTKDFATLERLTGQLLEMHVERQTALIALGGGVIGDLTGFAAAVTLRGIPFIQIPTTLLAQVDSSVGGKTGINMPHGKNLVGAFYQPLMVVADIGTLDTLPRRQLLAGYAEVLKYGLIDDEEFFAWLELHGDGLCDGDTSARRRAVLTSCASKAAIVAQDERETGCRALLNLGHTFAHALEVQTGYGDKLLHGEAVAIGMVMAFDLSVRLGLCPADDADRVRTHLVSVGLPVDCRALADASWNADVLIGHMGLDKKVKDGRLTFILAHGIGQSFITDEVDGEAVHGLLSDVLAA